MSTDLVPRVPVTEKVPKRIRAWAREERQSGDSLQPLISGNLERAGGLFGMLSGFALPVGGAFAIVTVPMLGSSLLVGGPVVLNAVLGGASLLEVGALGAGLREYLLRRHELRWAERRAVTRIHTWIWQRWGLQVTQLQLAPHSLRPGQAHLFVDEGAADTISFLAPEAGGTDIRQYKIVRSAAGVTPHVVMVGQDGKNVVVEPQARDAVASVSVATQALDEHGRTLLARGQELVRALTGEHLAVEQRHAVDRATAVLREVVDLADRLTGLSMDARAVVFEELNGSLTRAVADLDTVQASLTAAAVRDVRVLADYTRETASQKSRLQLED